LQQIEGGTETRMLHRAQGATATRRLQTRLKGEHVAQAKDESTMHCNSPMNDHHRPINGIENRSDIMPLLTRRFLDLKTDRSVEQHRK
jgi:hypothetical protein